MNEKMRKLADELSKKAFGQILEERKNKEDVNVKKGIEAINKSIESNQAMLEAMANLSKEVIKAIGTPLITQFISSKEILEKREEQLVSAIQEYEPVYANLLALKSLIKEEGIKDER